MRCPAAWIWLLLAASCLLPGVASASVETELAFHRGVVAYGEDRLDDARAQFQKVLELDAEDTAALRYLGLIAQKKKDPAAAVGFYDRALALDPEDTEIQLDRGIALLDAGRVPEARQALAQVTQLEPDEARAHFFLGVALYRAQAYDEASAAFDRAATLDPELSDESRYYTGLSQVLAGNPEAAITSLSEVEDEGPLTPMARDLRGKLAPPRVEEQRRWRASLTAGFEWDDNPLISGATAAGVPIDSADSDFRGVFRASGAVQPYRTETLSTTVGYDGYLSLHADEEQVDLQIHNPWGAISYEIGQFRLGLRQDYSYTMRDLTEPFRHLTRTTPSIGYRPVEWSYTQLIYQFDWKDFRNPLFDPAVNRDGWRHALGVGQYFFLPEPYTYVRMGVYGDFNRTEGSEYEYDGIEAQFGAGYDFPWEISLSWLYRFIFRDYETKSIFSDGFFIAGGEIQNGFSQRRKDFRHILTFELAKTFAEHFTVSVGGSFTWNNTRVNFYDYSRHIIGAYVTYAF